MRGREWLTAGGIAVVATLLLQLPYLLGYLTAPNGMVYTGLLVNVEDANYITIIQRGREGAWLHSLRFTSEPDSPAFLYVFYLAWGHAARLLGLDATTMWHAARAMMDLVTFLAVFAFVGLFFQDAFERLTAFLLAIFGGGGDWFVFPWEHLDPTSATPADLKMADAHLFHAALTFPHYLGTIACVLVLFWCVLRLWNEKVTRREFVLLMVLAVGANVGVALVYPFFVILSCGVLCVYGLFLMWRAKRILWREVWIAAAPVVAVVPLVIYFVSALASSELLRVWSAQSQTLSPNPLHYVLTFAPYLVLAFLLVRRKGLGDNKRAFLWVWLLVVALLVYAPLGAQRRFLQGIQVPLAILATGGLFEVVLPRIEQTAWFRRLAQRPNYSRAGLERLMVALLALMVSASSAYQWLSAIALTTVVQVYPIFRPRGEVEGMDWLRGRASAEDVVLNAYLTGSYLPYRSGARTYLGHLYETIHFEDKQRAVDHFFDASTSNAERERWLFGNRIRYLFYGRVEQQLGKFNPATAEYLKLQFQNNDAAIYLVRIP